MKKTFLTILGLLFTGLFTVCARNPMTIHAEEAETESSDVTVATAVAGEVEMDYCCFGKGENIFVIIPGISAKKVTPNAEAIAQGFEIFSKDYTVYLFDIRNNIPDSYSVQEMAADTAAVIRSLGLKDVNIFGASMGGMIAQYIAVDNPDLVKSLVLGSTFARINPDTHDVLEQWIELAKTGDGYELNKAFSYQIYSEATMEAYKDAVLANGNDISEDELARFVICASAILDFDVYDRLDEISCDVLVLGCEGDRVTTEDGARELAKKLDCESYFYGPEYGHAVFDEAPDYRSRILEFIQGIQ